MSSFSPRVSVAHLIPAPFTQHAANAFVEVDALEKFYCTLIDDPESRWQLFAKQLAKVARFDLETNLKRRAITVTTKEHIQSYPFREAFRMLLSKGLKSPLIDDAVFHWGRDGFDRWVASQIGSSDVLYGYEYGALQMFESAKKKGIFTVYDTPSPEHNFVEELLAPEFERFPELQTPYRKKVERLHAERTERRRKEWELSDLIVTNSKFTAESWMSTGWSSKPVVSIPYGAPPVEKNPLSPSQNGPVRLLWAGTFSVRKGAHYLVEAIRSMSEQECSKFYIDVYGAVSLPPEILKSLSSNIHLKGSVPREELLREMQTSHLLVFPTLCDGFGLVVNEAFSQGLPVLTTCRAGASDLVIPGENGYLIQAASAEAISEGIRRALDSKDELLSMREKSQETALEWQWCDYRKALRNAVKSEFIENKSIDDGLFS